MYCLNFGFFVDREMYCLNFGFFEPRGKIKRGDKQETMISSRGMFDDDSITVSSTWELTPVGTRYS